jgi:conjugative transfer signal peptidase TraF
MRNRNARLRNALTPRGAGALAAAFVLCGYAASPPGSPSRAAFVWNATASAPVGLYRVGHGRAPSRGDLVLAIPAPSLAAFAARRGYLPAGVPLVKRIAAVAGDAVCARGSAIFVDGRFAAARLAADAKHRPIPAWNGCWTLRSGEVFLLMANVRTSFDGRYFGPTPAAQVVGLLDPIWTR